MASWALGSQGISSELNQPPQPWSLWPGEGSQLPSGLQGDVVFPWKPPSLSGNHPASISFLISGGLK